MQEIDKIRQLINEQIECNDCPAWQDGVECHEHKRHLGILGEALTALSQLKEKLKAKAIATELSGLDLVEAFGAGGKYDCPLLEAISENVIYPEMIEGSSDISYKKRTDYMTGWNDATMAICKNYEKIKEDLCGKLERF